MDRGATLVSLMKGIELGSAKRMSEVIGEVVGCGADRVAVVSGPNLAREIAEEQPSATVVACADPDRAEALQRACFTPYLRPYTNGDVVGCELGGTVKNVIALACGIAEGMGFGDNTRAIADHPRAGRDRPAGRRARRRPDDLRRAGRAGRPGGHLQLAAVAQPHLRRAARPRRVARRGAGRGPAPPRRA